MQNPSTASWMSRRITAEHGARATRRCCCSAVVALTVTMLGARPAAAQRAPATAPHVVIGSVRTADESRLVGAHVQLIGGGRAGGGTTAVVTQGDGAFRFDHLPNGAALFVVRRLGFRPETLSVEVPQLEGGPIVVLLERVAQPLAPVVVHEARRPAQLGSVFERRRAGGFGHYITRADIERRNPQRTTDLFRGMPGVTVGASGPRFRALGNAAACEPAYFLDGMPVGSGALDFDAISPRSIEAVEVYSGAATVPAALRSALLPGGCGAVVLWTRHGNTAPDPLGAGVAADSLENAVASGWAYTADQVELAAAPLPGFGPVPTYPDSLLAAGARGRVVAEFVVDARGAVDPETVGIVSSTHPLFAAAVREAVVGARFSPAYRDKHVVRQVVHLPVVFEPGAAMGKAP